MTTHGPQHSAPVLLYILLGLATVGVVVAVVVLSIPGGENAPPAGEDGALTDDIELPIDLWAGEPPAGPHNVLLVSLDTLRADRCGPGAPDDPYVTTPIMDLLAANGVYFEKCVTTNPITLPAHSSLLTGRYPPAHGVRDNTNFILPDAEVTLAETFKAQGYETAAFVSAATMQAANGLAQGFDIYNEDWLPAARAAFTGIGVPQQRGDLTVDAAIAWAEARNAERPFFCFLHLFDPHHPYAPPVDLRPVDARRPLGDPGLPPASQPGRYDAEVTFTDRQVGRLLAALVAEKELDNTVVVILADHGDGFGEHGELTHGYLAYHATNRVPLLVAGPGAAEGMRCGDAVVSIADIAPTLLALSGIEAPEAAARYQGVDLSPVVRGEGTPGSLKTRGVYFESFSTFLDFGLAPIRGIETPEACLLLSGEPELFAGDDEAQLTDLAPESAERVAGLRAELEAVLARLAEGDSAAAIRENARAGMNYPFVEESSASPAMSPASPASSASPALSPAQSPAIADSPAAGGEAGRSATTGAVAFGTGLARLIEETLEFGMDRTPAPDGMPQIRRFQQAQTAIGQGRWRVGAQQLEALLGENPDLPHAWLYLSNARLSLATQLFNQVVAQGDGAWPDADTARPILGQFGEATRAYERYAALVELWVEDDAMRDRLARRVGLLRVLAGERAISLDGDPAEAFDAASGLLASEVIGWRPEEIDAWAIACLEAGYSPAEVALQLSEAHRLAPEATRDHLRDLSNAVEAAADANALREARGFPGPVEE